MSTNFNTKIRPRTRVYDGQIKQYSDSVNQFESGTAFYREATNTAEVYEIDLRTSSLPPGQKGQAPSSLRAGQIVVFKASSDSMEEQKLQVTLDSGAFTFPLLGQSRPLLPKSISQNEIVIAFYNEHEGFGSFEVLGLYSQTEVELLNLPLLTNSLLFFGEDGELSVLPPGTNGDLLTFDGDEPVWQAP